MSYPTTIVQTETAPLAYSYIRFSTPDQIKGDSQRRQLELSIKYCEEHGFKLDTSLTMKDLGLSAFHGSHIKEGELGSFLKGVNSGAIPRGSYLLIEDFDRLSRMVPLDAQEIVRQILITIVTLSNRTVYSWERVNRDPGLIYTMTAAIILAHDESRKKQERLKAAWSNKRNNSTDRILTSICPSWMKVDKKKNEFVLFPTKVALIRRIFQMYIDGLGQYTIARILNGEGIPAPRNKL
jgi:DNA invertase Pin-like site-specific DNA recombinase